MRNETELKNLVQRAQRADELLNDPLMTEWIAAVKGKLFLEFESVGLNDEKSRKNTWQKIQLLNSFLDETKKTIKDGKNAKLTLMEQASAVLRRII